MSRFSDRGKPPEPISVRKVPQIRVLCPAFFACPRTFIHALCGVRDSDLLERANFHSMIYREAGMHFLVIELSLKSSVRKQLPNRMSFPDSHPDYVSRHSMHILYVRTLLYIRTPFAVARSPTRSFPARDRVQQVSSRKSTVHLRQVSPDILYRLNRSDHHCGDKLRAEYSSCMS